MIHPVGNASMLCAVQIDRHHRDFHHWVHRKQGLDLWLLELSLSGEGKFILNGETQAFSEGKAILYKPYAEQNYGFDSTGEWIHFWATFSPRSHWKPWLNWDGIAEGVGQIDIPAAQLTHIENLCQLAVQQFKLYRESKWEWVMLQLEAIFLSIFESGALSNSPQKDPRIQKVCAWMQDHFSQSMSIEFLAQKCYLSPSRFSHLFQDQMGLSPIQYLESIKMDSACLRLRMSSDNMANISETLGFKSQHYFSRCFKKHFGCSPSDYRAQGHLNAT